MTPSTSYALVPATPGDDIVQKVVLAMAQALASPARMKDGPVDMIGSMRHVAEAGASALLSASPNAGRVTAEMLERAARARGDVIARRNRVNLPWEALPEHWRVEIIEDMRVIFESIGLQVDAPAGEVVDG